MFLSIFWLHILSSFLVQFFLVAILEVLWMVDSSHSITRTRKGCHFNVILVTHYVATSL